MAWGEALSQEAGVRVSIIVICCRCDLGVLDHKDQPPGEESLPRKGRTNNKDYGGGGEESGVGVEETEKGEDWGGGGGGGEGERDQEDQLKS